MWKNCYTKLIWLMALVGLALSSCNEQVEPAPEPSNALAEFDFEKPGTKDQDDSVAYSGTYALKLTPDSPYGASVTDSLVKTGAIYRMQVRYFGPPEQGYLVATSPDSKDFYERKNEGDTPDSSGWKLLEQLVFIPPGYTADVVKFFVWNKGQKPAWFDDFKVERLEDFHYPEYPNQGFDLLLPEKSMEELEEKRKTAFQVGLLQTKQGDYVSGSLKYKGKEWPVKVRLKGDYLDHLKGPKWSFRVKVKKNKSVLGMSAFSLQNPKARYFLDQWIFHQVMEQESLLATRYRFEPLRLNGESLGYYACEEHFTDSLIAHYGRPPGVIIRFSEDGLWEMLRTRKEQGKELGGFQIESAEIKPYSSSTVLEDPALRKEFLKARDKLNAYRYDQLPVSKVFELESTARFFALTDLFLAGHGVHWHNQRYYWNPQSERLEIVSYDGFTEYQEHERRPSLFLDPPGQPVRILGRMRYYPLQPFNDPAFQERYLHYLNVYSQPDFLNRFFEQHRVALAAYEEAIRQEYPEYHFRENQLINRAARIQELLRDELPRYRKEGFPVFVHLPKNNNSDSCDPIAIKGFSVRVFMESENSRGRAVTIRNYHCAPIEVLGSSVGSDGHRSYLDQPTVIPACQPNGIASSLRILLPKGSDVLIYRTEGGANQQVEEIVPWSAPLIPNR